MILTVDIGNTNIVLGAFQGEELVFHSRLRTNATKTVDEYCIDLKMLLEIYRVDLKDIEGSILASVVPQVMNNFKSAIIKLTGKPCLVVGPGLKTGLNLKVENPAQTGADLVAASVAALRMVKPPLMIVDMGTATSIMVLDGEGAFIGGCIAPGVRISLDALTEKSALLPGLQLDAPKKAIGRNTIACMRSGVLLGSASMIDGMIDRMEAELGSHTTVIATGGIAKFVVPHCRRQIRYERDLVLRGLAIIYRENTKK